MIDMEVSELNDIKSPCLEGWHALSEKYLDDIEFVLEATINPELRGSHATSR